MVSAVGKAAALLRAFDPGVDVLSTRALAARTGIPRSTVHVLAATLAAEGLLETVPGRGWRLGPAAGRAGRADHRAHRARRRRRGRPRAALLRAAGQEVHVGQLVGGWVVYLHREAGADGPGDDGQPRRPARAGLAGRLREGGAGAARARGGRRADRAAVPGRGPGPARTGAARRRAAPSAGRPGYLVSSSFQAGRTSVAAAVVDGDARPARRALGGRPDDVCSPGPCWRRTVEDVVAAAGRARLAVRTPGAQVRRGARTTARSDRRSPTERNAVVPPRRLSGAQ